MKSFQIVACFLVSIAAARELKPNYLYFAEYLEEPSFQDLNMMNVQPFEIDPVWNLFPGNGLNYQIQTDLIPFHYLPDQPFMSSNTFDHFNPSSFYSPVPYDTVTPIEIRYPLIFDYTFNGFPQEVFAYPLPYETIPSNPYPVPISMPNNPMPKIGITFPKPESIMEQPNVPFSFDYEKLLPEKVGRTFPTTSLTSDQYRAPSRVGFGYESARMEPIIAQNLWNKK